jgi:hypothetical protein
MARAINSPGVQIIETDLSNYQQTGGGTTVFVPGFASQGPTDEILLVTTAAELDRIYGTPETPAERYFYYTCREILNSPATLLTTRLPYGSGSGEGFTDNYGALFYPVASSAEGFTIGQPIHKTLSQTVYNNLVQNNFSWSSISTTSSAASFDGATADAGIIVLNSSIVGNLQFFPDRFN